MPLHSYQAQLFAQYILRTENNVGYSYMIIVIFIIGTRGRVPRQCLRTKVWTGTTTDSFGDVNHFAFNYVSPRRADAEPQISYRAYYTTRTTPRTPTYYSIHDT